MDARYKMRKILATLGIVGVTTVTPQTTIGGDISIGGDVIIK